MDTTIGRFTSMDSYLGSVDDPVSLHKYLYANANPVNYIDPSGYNSYGEMNLALKIQLILTDITTLKINMYCWYIRLGEASIGGKILKEVIDESFELLLEGDVDIYSVMWTSVEIVYGLADSEQEFSTLKKTNKSGKYSGTGEYRDVKGHHVHAKAAFKGNVKYDPNKGFSISQDFMDRNGLNHQKMTSKQRELFKELYESGRPNTLDEHTRIAKEALKAGGASESMINDLVEESLSNLAKQGVTQPTRIPWYSK